MTQAGPDPGGTWLLQNRAHAHFNNVYMVCPNVGPVYVHPAMEHPFDIGGGGGHVVDFQGNVLGISRSGANSFCAGLVDIEALRNFRTMNLNSNWMKDLRTEVFRKHLRRADPPGQPVAARRPEAARRGGRGVPRQHRAADRSRLLDGAGAPPSRQPVSPPSQDPADGDWENVKGLWEGVEA